MKIYFYCVFMMMNAMNTVMGKEGNGNALNEGTIPMLNCNQSACASSNSRMDKLETIIDRMGTEMAELKIQNNNLVNRVELLESPENLIKRKSRYKRATVSSNPPAILNKKCLSRYYEYPDMKIPDGNRNVVPNSCNDLQLMGHKLNGFYAVQGRDANANKIETIFCNFSDSLTLKSTDFKAEKRFGFMDIKTKSVYFYVQKNSDFSQPNERVPFEVEYLNIGKGFNMSTSVFTAPVYGIYTFSFSSLKGGSGGTSNSIYPFSFSSVNWGTSNEVNVYLRLNGKPVGLAYATGNYQYIPLMIHSTLKLEAGNTVDLWLQDGDIRDHKGHHTHFIGWLQEQELTPGK